MPYFPRAKRKHPRGTTRARTPLRHPDVPVHDVPVPRFAVPAPRKQNTHSCLARADRPFYECWRVPKRDAPSCAIQRCTLTRTRQGKMFACEFLSPAAGTPERSNLSLLLSPTRTREEKRAPHSAPVPCLPRPRPETKCPPQTPALSRTVPEGRTFLRIDQ